MEWELQERYSPQQRQKIQQFLNQLAVRTRKSGRISENRQNNIVREWTVYDADVVMAAMDVFLKTKTTPAQNEKYVKGIMRNKQKEKEATGHEGNGRNFETGKGSAGGRAQAAAGGILDEGERLCQISQGKNQGELTCDF